MYTMDFLSDINYLILSYRILYSTLGVALIISTYIRATCVTTLYIVYIQKTMRPYVIMYDMSFIFYLFYLYNIYIVH